MPSPASSGGSGGGGTVFIPPGQSGVAEQLGGVLGPLAGLAANGGAGTPAGSAFPAASNLVQQYLTGSIGGGGATPFNDFAGGALNDATLAAGYGPTLFNQGSAGSQGLSDTAGAILPYAGNIASNAFGPMYNSLVGGIADNPYYPQAQAGAGAGAGYGQGAAGSLYSAGQSLLDTGFDPQRALFDRTQQQVLDQSNAVNAMSGVAGTPYGASVTGNTLGNFDINWQNAQLGRQAQASAAASPLLQAAPGEAASSAAMPYNLSAGNIGQILAAMQQRNVAGQGGAGALASLLSGAGSGMLNAQNLGASSAASLASLGGLPYNTGAGIAGGALNGLSNLTNLGNNQYLLPQQIIADLMQYMGLGQSASGLSGQLGQMGVNQLGQGIGGIGSLLGGANRGIGNIFNTSSATSPLFGFGSIFGPATADAGAAGLMGLGAGTPLSAFTDAVMMAAL